MDGRAEKESLDRYHCTKNNASDDLEHAFVQIESAPATSFAGKRNVKYTADDDYDRLILEQWRRHIADIGPEKARVRGWGGSYWQRWVEKIDIG